MSHPSPPCTTEELIAELNRLLAEEVEAAVRYLHLLMSLRSPDGQVAPLMQQAYSDTVAHARELGEKIRRLGGQPRLDLHLVCSPGEVSPEEAVADVLTFEEAALEGYQELFDRVRAAGADAEVVEFARRQVELETEHVEMFRRLGR